MDTAVIVALIGTMIALGGSMFAIFLNRDTSNEQLVGAQAYKTLTEALTNLTEQNEGLRALLNQKESYIVYLIDGIRERCSEWKPRDFLLWQKEHTLAPEDASAITSALLDAFDLAAFDRMLLTRVGRRREQITTANGLTQIVTDVVQHAIRENWLEELKQGARLANPKNERLQQTANLPPQ